ncbi:response regulator transcription factor [Telmatospirillum siberiense]|uniref:DNA-binding response regulator n=1 Tax=Telmatospirillum siberiense TaxID=382514 RepID=A0A2N3PXN6_9PROT|nr:response regulator transcription factor [Telmatospirillum siberiense]PKU25172.1 DNA-binding response regulator [Telmatospirillum siberiense]
MPEKKRVLLIDDHAVVRAGCRMLLEGWGGLEVVEAASASEALRLMSEVAPALVLLDLNLPDGTGLDLIAPLLALDSGVRILVFSMHEDAAHATRAMERGAHGYVTKSDDPETIVEAAATVLGGAPYLSRPVAQKLALAGVGGMSRHPLAGLTRRERAVFDLFGQGKTLSEIAAQLDVSYKTVANTCSQLKTRLHVSNSAELMRLAIENGR